MKQPFPPQWKRFASNGLPQRADQDTPKWFWRFSLYGEYSQRGRLGHIHVSAFR